MKLTLEQAVFHKALAQVTAVVERRNTILILSNVKIEAEASGDVWLTATDLDMEVRRRLSARVDEAGAITVPASTMTDIVRSAPAGAEIALHLNDGRLEVVFGRSRYKVAVLSAADFPNKKPLEKPTTFEIPAPDLAAMLAEAGPAMSTDETRYWLNGAFLEPVEVEGQPLLRLVATDGHRLSMAIRSGIRTDPFQGVIVPRKTVQVMNGVLSGQTDTVALGVGFGGVEMTIGDLVIRSKIVDGAFPEYMRVVPSDWDHEIEIDRSLLAAAVQRVAIVARDANGSVKLVFDDGQLTLQVRNMQADEGVETVEIDYQGPMIETGVNSRYLLSALAQSEADNVVFRMTDGISPIRIEPPANDHDHGQSLAIIMPLRV